MAGEAPFITRCSPSKKSAEYSGYEAIALNPGNGAKTVLVHSQPLPTRSSTPQALLPLGWLPAGSGSQLEKSNTPCSGDGLGVSPRVLTFAIGRPGRDPERRPLVFSFRHEAAPRHRAYAAASA